MSQKPIGFNEIGSLVNNFYDPKTSVQVASLRAATRLAGLRHEFEPRARDVLLNEVQRGIRSHGSKDILGVSYLPQRDVREEIRDILPGFGSIDVKRAALALKESVNTIAGFNPRMLSFPTGRNLLQKFAEQAAPPETSKAVTSLFAELASPSYDADPQSHERLASAEDVTQTVARMQTRFQPDVRGLFNVYQAFLPASLQFWIDWLETMQRQEGLDVSRSMPSWFPLHVGELAVTRQLEWTMSRAPVIRLLTELQERLSSSDPGERLGAAQLIENAARYASVESPPRFGGGAGPDDVASEVLLRNMPPLSYEAATGTGVDEPVDLATEARRYTDVTLFAGHCYNTDELTERLEDDRALVAGEKYTLEVTVRLRRKGIDAHLDPGRAAKNPRQDKETLRVFMLAEALDEDLLEIVEPFAAVDWPFDKDSESALFRILTKKSANARTNTAIEVRLYDSSLDLLDKVRLKVVVVKDSEDDRIDLSEPRVTWPGEIDSELHVPAERLPRLLSIDVGLRAATGYYTVLFKFRAAREKKELEIPGSASISPKDLEPLLADVRDFWTELVITNYSGSLQVSGPTYQKYLLKLRDLGMRAWRLLFGDRYADLKGASETLGELLTKLRGADGELIQITYSEVEDFVFPWNIVHPPSETEKVDPLEFWGARYQIEQVTAGPRSDSLLDEPVRVSFALDRGFKNSDAQEQLLRDYAQASGGKLVVSDPASEEAQFFSELEGHPSAHLYYFYCHGYAPSAKHISGREGIQLLRQKIQEIHEGTPEREALETLLTLTSKMNDEPWIYIGSAEVKQSRLQQQRFFERPRRPIVFMNMCQSADLMPGQSSGLVRVFLDRNASVVVGTESPMTGVFAHAFSKLVLDELFAYETVGKALWKARRHFLSAEQRNPLGLAYTLYGRAVGRLGSGPVVPAGQDSKTENIQDKERHGER